MKFAYADPPYLGCCKLYDHFHGDDGRCWDDLDTHKALIGRLCADYPDGWALSATSNSLRHLLPLCPDDVRVAAWVKPFHAYKRGVRPAYAWEPIIYRGGRNKNAAIPPKGGKAVTPKDFIAENITLKKGLTGAKPERVCDWILALLNVQPGDDVDDLFPGTGVMDRRVHAIIGGRPVDDDDPIPTISLFPMTPTVAKPHRPIGEAAKRVVVVGWVGCPKCSAGERTAVIRDGEHLVYRPHTYRTWSGAPMECGASWQRLCDLRMKPWTGAGAIAGCICGRS